MLVNTSSSGRYQFWQSAVRAAETEPLTGIGPGTFEFYWSQDPEGYAFVRDAHSLYIENLAELGWIGFGLIVSLVLATLAIGIGRSINAPLAARTRIATATAAAAAFAAGAGLDWIWEIAALPALFMLLAAVIAVDTEGEEPNSIRVPAPADTREGGLERFGPRVAVVAVALAAILAVWFPLRARSESARARSTSPTVTYGRRSPTPRTPQTHSPTPPAPRSSRRSSSSFRARSQRPSTRPAAPPARRPRTGATGSRSPASRHSTATPKHRCALWEWPSNSYGDRSDEAHDREAAETWPEVWTDHRASRGQPTPGGRLR